MPHRGIRDSRHAIERPHGERGFSACPFGGCHRQRCRTVAMTCQFTWHLREFASNTGLRKALIRAPCTGPAGHKQTKPDIVSSSSLIGASVVEVGAAASRRTRLRQPEHAKAREPSRPAPTGAHRARRPENPLAATERNPPPHVAHTQHHQPAGDDRHPRAQRGSQPRPRHPGAAPGARDRRRGRQQHRRHGADGPAAGASALSSSPP